MSQDFSIISLVLHASLVVQLVIAGLLLTSLASWTVIFAKLISLRALRRGNEAFEREFWSGKNLTELHTATGQAGGDAPMTRIFAAGMREFLKLRERTGSIFVVTDATLRYLRPARLDDALQITVESIELRQASMRLTQRALRGDTLLCEGEIRIGCVRAADLKPQRLPDSVVAALHP